MNFFARWYFYVRYSQCLKFLSRQIFFQKEAGGERKNKSLKIFAQLCYTLVYMYLCGTVEEF